MKKPQLRVALSLAVSLSIWYTWWTCNRSPFVFPAKKASNAQQGSSSSLPGQRLDVRPPTTDFLDLTFQHDLPVARLDPYPASSNWNLANRRYRNPRPCRGPRKVTVNGNAEDLLLVRSTTKSGTGTNSFRVIASCCELIAREYSTKPTAIVWHILRNRS